MQPDGPHRPGGPRPLASAAFRFALLIALVFGLGGGALLIAVGHQVGRYAAAASDGMLSAEAAVLAGEQAELGRDGLIDALKRHGRAGDDPPYRYLLTNGSGRRLYGDLPTAAARLGRHEVTVREYGGFERMATLGRRLPDGMLLVIATDGFDVGRLRDDLIRSTMVSALLIVALVLAGGYAAGRLFIARLDLANGAIDRIVEGDRAERIPPIGFGAEFDALARNLNRMLDRNEASIAALRQVSTDVAHDLRTPLTRLHQRLERMQRDGVDASAVEEALAQTAGLLSTFSALLRIGTVEGGVGRRRFGPVDLSALLERIAQMFAPVAEDEGHQIVAEVRPGAVVLGDEELLAQLFINLVENAIVHTPAGTTICVILAADRVSVAAEIADDGPGIPADERKAVFRRFHRLDSSRHTEGAGLGLALVAAVAGLHDAHCSIIDEPHGTRVRIVFPPRADGPT